MKLFTEWLLLLLYSHVLEIKPKVSSVSSMKVPTKIEI